MSHARPEIRNLFRDVPAKRPEETFESLLELPGLRIERIVSWGHVTPEWYVQEQDEWVMVLQGQARLQVDSEDEIAMSQGDSIFLPSGCRHRVSWTHEDAPTLWLAIHYWADGASEPRDSSA